MKKLFTLGAIALVMFSCKKEAPVSGLKDQDLGKLQQLEATVSMDEGLELIAKQLAASLRKKEMRQFIKAEAQKKFDGDNNFLFKEGGNKLVDGQAFLNHLSGKNLSNDLKAQEKADGLNKQLEAISKELPLLQIAVPVNIEKWDTESFIPLVAIKSLDYNEKTTEKIKAFDQDGNIHWLDAKKEPDYPVIVIGMNERTEILAGGEVKLKKGFEKTQIIKSSSQGNTVSLVLPPDDDGGGGGGGGGTVGIYPVITQWCRKNNYYEFLTAINCTDISQYEGWIAGDPELRLSIYVPNFSTATLPNPVMIRFNPSRSSVDNKWLSVSNQLHVWNLEVYGEDVVFNWHEEDSNLNWGKALSGVASAFKQLQPKPGVPYMPIPSGVINEGNLTNYLSASATLANSIQIEDSDSHIGTTIVNFRNCLSFNNVGDRFQFKSTTL